MSQDTPPVPTAFERCFKVIDGLLDNGLLVQAQGAALTALAVAEGHEERVQALAVAIHVDSMHSHRQKRAAACLAITKEEAEAALAIVREAHEAKKVKEGTAEEVATDNSDNGDEHAST